VIERYTLPEMADLWNEEAKFRAWLRIELAVCRARASLGEIPAEEAEELAQKADFTTQRVKEIEKETNHDVIAFVTAVSETVAETGAADVARHFHFGLTSSDVLRSDPRGSGVARHPTLRDGVGAPRYRDGRPNARGPRRAHHSGTQARRMGL
jgi:hypothetical protein